MSSKPLCLVLLVLSFSASAVVIRDDVDDAKYRVPDSELLALSDLPMESHGVLIDPRWVVTAVHATRTGLITSSDNGDTIGAGTEYDRAAIVKGIKVRVTFVTIMMSQGSWQKGQPGYIIKVNGVEYIKTVDNGQPRDNLENSPEF